MAVSRRWQHARRVGENCGEEPARLFAEWPRRSGMEESRVSDADAECDQMGGIAGSTRLGGEESDEGEEAEQYIELVPKSEDRKTIGKRGAAALPAPLFLCSSFFDCRPSFI